MTTSTAFEWLCEELEEQTSLDRLQARGTVRIALKQAGLEAGSATAEQIAVVVTRVLPGELAGRGVEDVEAVCRQAATQLEGMSDGSSSRDTPEAVFARLGA